MAQALSSGRVRGGFGGGKSLSLRAIILTAAAHAAAVPFAIGFGGAVIAAPEERLAMFDLAPPPAPPPPPDNAPPPPDRQASSPQVMPDTAPALTPALAPPQPAQPVSLGLAPMPAPAATTAAAPQAAHAVPAARSLAPAAPATIASAALDTTLIAGRPPHYPRESRRKREQGTVTLQLTVGTDGRVEAIAIARSSGSPRLDAAALEAVQGWRWQPLRRDGQPVRVRGLVEIPFILTSGRKSPSRADCNPADPDCHPDRRPQRPDRGGRLDRRDSDIRHPGTDGEA